MIKILKAKEKRPDAVAYRNKTAVTKKKKKIIYPDSDGKPMAENTLQYEWIVKIKENLEFMFENDPDVFIAGDLLWYPVEGDNKTVIGPDVLMAFGRPKGRRGSYKTWEEGHVNPQVVFEILSPSNYSKEMKQKLQFYEQYGIEEYYEYDPDNVTLKGWCRSGGKFHPITEMHGWVSPKLGIRFEIKDNDMMIFKPENEPFFSMLELNRLRKMAEHRAEIEKQRADVEKQRADMEKQRADGERERAESLAAKLRELGIEL